ncbi:MAG TPA: alpha/beta fold hydrolase [Steroidobacteraceae bacterium]|nr:alpha/beta fold hydrolase [Steroidobacteraceae bacterium]
MPISRHFATIRSGRFGARQVHYRRTGQGPLVLMLHQSPLSSRDMEATMLRWQDRFTMIAPDTPGYGLSDPFGFDSVEMDDIAEAVVEFLDAIGVARCAVYGFHTGAMIVGALAARYPDRISGAVANGYVVLSPEERDDIVAHYLPAFEPQWDGSHLTWLWARMREQTIFFPWYARHRANRLDFDVPSPETLQAGLVEFLRAGDNYRIGYRAAFTFRSLEALTKVRTPMLVTAADFDPLHEHLQRITRKSPSVDVVPGGTLDATLNLAGDFLARHARDEAPAVAATAPLPGRMWNEMVEVPGGQLRVRRNTDAPGQTVVVQHDAASASDTVDAVSQSLIGHRPVLAIDLPGHGESDNTIGERDVTVARYAEAVDQVLDAFGLEQVDFYGMWGGGLVGLEMATRRPGRIAHLVMSDVLWFDEALTALLEAHYTPPIEVNWYGGHLLMCWHLMRDQGLFWPWFDRSRAGIIWREPWLDPAMIQLRVTNMLKAPTMWRLAYQAHFAYPIKERLPSVRVPVLLCAPSWDPNFPHTEEAAAATGHQMLTLPDDMGEWGPALLDFIDR